MQEGRRVHSFTANSDINIALLNGVPDQVTEWATPYTAKDNMNMDLGIYIQDQWTLKRLTITSGLRFDHLNSEVPAQSIPATQFVPGRHCLNSRRRKPPVMSNHLLRVLCGKFTRKRAIEKKSEMSFAS